MYTLVKNGNTVPVDFFRERDTMNSENTRSDEQEALEKAELAEKTARAFRLIQSTLSTA